MKTILITLLTAITLGYGQTKITVVFNDITNGNIDTVFFQVDSFVTDCSMMDGASLHRINGPEYSKSKSPVDNKVYLPIYDIYWEHHPIMGDIITWTDFHDNFQCTALYLFGKKDLYLSK